MKAPSTKQLDYLARLGYSGPTPTSSAEASHLIDQLKSGSSSKSAQKSAKKIRKHQAQREKQDRKRNREYLEGLEQMMRDSDGVFKCAGFRMKRIKDETPGSDLIYHNAFLPFDVAKQFPDLLLLDLDIDELERTPKKGNVVCRPGVVTDIEKLPATGCSRVAKVFLLSVVCAVVALWLLFGRDGKTPKPGYPSSPGSYTPSIDPPFDSPLVEQEPEPETKDAADQARPQSIDSDEPPAEPSDAEMPTPDEPDESPADEPPKYPRLRKWTSAGGGFTVEAEIISMTDDNVELKRADGKVIKVPFDKFSESDRKYIEEWRKKKLRF